MRSLEPLRGERAERAIERADRVAAVGEAERNATELRRAEATRRGQGRWTRLRAAWRGE
jgi:hypothetical protein